LESQYIKQFITVSILDYKRFNQIFPRELFLPDEMLKNKFDDCKVGPWKSFEKLSQLKHFDASIIDHLKKGVF